MKENLDEEIKPEEIELVSQDEQIMVNAIAINGQLHPPDQDRSLLNPFLTKLR